MKTGLQIRLMTHADLSMADALRARAGWNQTAKDWRRFLDLEPDGCFVAEWDRTVVATATTIAYGTDLAWIGMMLVHPDFRRRGIATALLQHCIETMRGRGVRCIKLDATPEGQKVYERLTFAEELKLTRWEHAAIPSHPFNSKSTVRSYRESDRDEMVKLDHFGFGVNRAKLVQTMAGDRELALVVPSLHADEIEGFGLLRAGARAHYLGPVTARNERAGLELLKALLARVAGKKIFWDIPDQNVAAPRVARDWGFTAQRNLTRMFLGENLAAGRPLNQFAIAGPEVG